MRPPKPIRGSACCANGFPHDHGFPDQALDFLPNLAFAVSDHAYSIAEGRLFTREGAGAPAAYCRVGHDRRPLAPEGRPGRQYLNQIREAARQRKLPPAYVDFLDRIEARE
jgi:hypothetical protein